MSYFDLEDPRSLTQLAEPMTALESMRALIVIDDLRPTSYEPGISKTGVSQSAM